MNENLRAHGLIQAYSRTNRILNSVKTYGNIVSFRDLEEATNDALALFGNKEARGIVLLKPYADYYAEYERLVAELVEEYPLELPILGEAAKKRFISLFGAILRLRNILTSFDEFDGHEILSPRDLQDYQSIRWRVSSWTTGSDQHHIRETSRLGRGAQVVDVHHVSDRFEILSDGGPHTVEQQAYYQVNDGRISYWRVLCPAYRASDTTAH